MFQSLFAKKDRKTDPQALYGEVVARARSVPFFTDFGVPDTFDGRFELMVMHVYLLIARLNEEGNVYKEQAQYVFDLFLDDMSAGMREAGVGDTIVPKRLKKMSRVFYGRAAAWDEALASDDPQAELALVIGRNLFDRDDANTHSAALARYMIAEKAALSTREVSKLKGNQGLFSTSL